ncbi:MAG TPA: STAS domain-containing protein [Micromonosporaceae bacterium]|jgi:anti-anti-sigma factor
MAMTAAITQTGGVVAITLHGPADYSVVTLLLDTFAQARSAPGARRIVVDLADVRFMDSSGLSAFISGFRFARQDGLRFEVVNPVRSVQSLLEMTGVAHLFATVDDD